MRMLAVICFVLAQATLARPAMAAQLGAFDGLPILDVTVSEPSTPGVADSGDLSDVRGLIDLEPGYIFRTNDLTQVVKRLYAIGRFADIAVDVTMVGRAVSVRFTVSPQRMLRALKFAGDTDKDVIIDLKNAVLPGEPVNEATQAQLKKRCERTWALVGYDAAVCDVSTAPDGDDVDVTVAMHQGPPTVITHIEFIGNVRAPERELRRELQLLPGVRFTDKKYKEDERALRLAFYSRGFLTAGVRSEAKQDPQRQDGVIVTYTIEAGDRVVLQVRGNHVLKDSELLAELRRQPDERLFPGTLDDWRRRVLALYRTQGYANAEAKVIPYIDSKSHVLHDVLTITEGRRVDVTDVQFNGATFFSQERLQSELFATIDSKLDVPLLSGRVDPDATKSLYDPHTGYNHTMPVGSPHVTSPVWREATSKIYDPDSYAAAIDNIRRLYLEQGFTEVKIGAPELTPSADGTHATVAIPVSEGPRSLVRSVSFSHTTAYDEEQVFSFSTVRLGEPYSELQIEETKSLLLKALARKGYLYAQISEEEGFSEDHRSVDVAFTIREGDQVRVGRIIIQGGSHTSPSVVRDRIVLKSGEPYSPELAAQTKDNLLGSTSIGGIQSPIEVFDSVNVSLVEPDTPAERKDVLIRLLSRAPNDVAFGAGISTGQGVRVSGQFVNHNFFGTASVLTLRAQVNRQLPIFMNTAFYGPYAPDIMARYTPCPASKPNCGNFSFLDSIERSLHAQVHTPRYLRLPGSPFFYVEAGDERRNALSYSLDSVSLLGGIDVAVSQNVSFVYENALAFNQLTCYTDPNAAKAVASQTGGTQAPTSGCAVYSGNVQQRINEGAYLQARFGPKLVLDLRPVHERVNPRHGFVADIRTDYIVGEQLATDIGGQHQSQQLYSFIRLDARLRGYIPIGRRSSIMLGLAAGNIFALNGSNVIDGLGNERFYLGGPNTLRGFVDQSIIPQDACVVPLGAPAGSCPGARANRQAVYTPAIGNAAYQPPISSGGAFYEMAQVEYRFPLVGDLFGALFVDTGNLYFDVRDYAPWKLRVDVGAGIRYATGVGNVAIDWGFNVDPSKLDGEYVPVFPYFYFSVF